MVSPAPIRVARRAVILYTLMMRFTAETNPTDPRAKDWLEILPQWLDRLEARSEIEPWDAEILATPLGELGRQQRTDARWGGEAVGVLGWALQRVAAPADFDPVDPNKVFPALGFDPAGMVQSAREFIAVAALRPKDELLSRKRTWSCGCRGSRRGLPRSARLARRDLEVAAARSRGETLQALADRYGLSRQRVQQIVRAEGCRRARSGG
jgi:hypothetical protein